MPNAQYLALQDQRNTHIGRYLLELSRSFIEATLNHLQANGFESVTPHHIHIISQIDIQGTPVAELLIRSGVTKQSLSNTLNILESNGFVQRVLSEHDARSRDVEFTAKGMKLLSAGIDAVNEVEEQYASILGRQCFQEVKENLGKLHHSVIQE